MLSSSRRLLVQMLAPAAEPLTLAETKQYLRVDHSDDDTLITNLIVAARIACEEYLRKSLITQKWKVAFDDYAQQETPLVRGPVQSIDSVTMCERDGSSETVSADNYFLNAAKDMVVFDTIIYGHRVEVIYSTGYGASGSYVPAPIKYGLLAHVSTLYDNRGDAELVMPNESLSLYLPFREVML